VTREAVGQLGCKVPWELQDFRELRGQQELRVILAHQDCKEHRDPQEVQATLGSLELPVPRVHKVSQGRLEIKDYLETQAQVETLEQPETLDHWDNLVLVVCKVRKALLEQQASQVRKVRLVLRERREHEEIKAWLEQLEHLELTVCHVTGLSGNIIINQNTWYFKFEFHSSLDSQFT
jgi:hypothetical protein